VAFGGGQRLCAGIEFARVETLVTMHHLAPAEALQVEALL